MAMVVAAWLLRAVSQAQIRLQLALQRGAAAGQTAKRETPAAHARLVEPVRHAAFSPPSIWPYRPSEPRCILHP
eukprot:426965-Pleurochrysis_carterae.AAC.2